MSWLSRVFRKPADEDTLTLLRLRTTRFRQLLGSYGAFVALLEDAAEKQGGSFILDRQYVIALAEQAAELGDAAAYDLNVITVQKNLAFYDVAERLRAELRNIVAQGSDGEKRAESEVPSRAGAPTETVSPAALAEALGHAEVLYRQRGQVACRGVAAGPVCNLAEGAPVTPGGVLVATDLAAEESVLATAGRAGAILLDRGSAAGAAARRARELRIPAIVGLSDATLRLASGVEVTVDADENIVYLGQVPELLAYYGSGQIGSGEEEEYRLLRSVRRAVFPLTLAKEPTEPSLPSCRTIHDLVHLARSLAGDALCALLTVRPGPAGALVRFAGTAGCEARVVILAGSSPDGSSGSMVPSDLPSRPLRSFLGGLTSQQVSAGSPLPAGPSCTLHAAVTDEHCLAVRTLPGGFDMLDATAAEMPEANTVYCRFAPLGENDPEGIRGALASGVLARLGFSATVTRREVSGWIRGLPALETGERIRILGGFFARLNEIGPGGWAPDGVEASVEAFMRGCT